MHAIHETRLRSSKPEDIARVVADVYCPHVTLFKGIPIAPSSRFEIRRAGRHPIIELAYGVRAEVDAGQFPGLLLIRTCLQGSGAVTQQGASVSLRGGETVPMSAGLSTQLQLDARFAQRSVKLDVEHVETSCARMLNRPLDSGLRFELRPFSKSMEKAWTGAIDLLMSYASMNLQLAAASMANLDNFLVSLLLTHHPHNYSDELAGRTLATPSRLVRDADHLMRTGGNEMTVLDVAAQLQVSLRSLEVGFREHLCVTPIQHLRAIRLERVRNALLAAQPSTSVTSAALECGFVHLARFSAYYKAAFGELPAHTLRRARMNMPADRRGRSVKAKQEHPER